MKGNERKINGNERKIKGNDQETTIFRKKKSRKKKLSDLNRQVQQRGGFGGSSFSHEKTGDVFTIYCKNQYETHPASVPGAQQ